MITSICRHLITNLLLLFVLLTGSAAFADEAHNVLSGKVTAAHNSGISFNAYSLFKNINGVKHTATLKQETSLQADAIAVTALFNKKPMAVSIILRDEKGIGYTLELLQSQPTADNFNPGTIEAGGFHQAAYTPGLHYQGHVAGIEKSLATMSVFANGDVMILFSYDQGNFIVGKVEDGSGNYVFYNDVDMLNRPYTPCGVHELDQDLAAVSNTGNKATSAKLCHKVQVYWEVANRVFLNKGTLVLTQNYVTGLFNQFQAMYANENIGMELKSMYVWTAADDYPTASSNVALDKFKAFWNSLNNKFDGNIAHLLTRDNSGNGGGNGGLAYVDVLCSRNYGYGYSDIYGTYQNIPTFSWDVEVITHETGHNLGSNHTHWCGWMTGANNTCGSIDNCYTQETTSTCSSCGSTYLNSAATTAWQGTVMSYCHLVARGINLANGFGPLPGALIRSKVNANTCLGNIISAKLTPTAICSSDGAIGLSLNNNNLATAPYTYQWSNNAQSQNLSGLTTAGNYSVTVTDSNNCTNTAATTLLMQPNPGNGIAVANVLMPICCNNTTYTLTLAATAPQSLSNCETVAWLRTPVPITNGTDAKTAADTAKTTDLFYSTNSNVSNGATLIITPPTTCNGPVTWYYTPFVSRTSKTMDSITTTSAAMTSIFSGTSTTQIGAFISLPDQSTLPAACSLIDTPSSTSLTVIVSGYTGRANFMTILVQNAADSSIVYRLSAAAGNGTYTIPMAAFQSIALNQLKVSVFDFNCSNTTTCTSSQVTVSATRTVTYAAITKPLADKTCHPGASIRVDFAPFPCTPLSVTPITSQTITTLFPNPATHAITLQFGAINTGNTSLRVTDIVGKTMMVEAISYKSGINQHEIDVHRWARGVYFLTFSKDGKASEKLRFVVE